MAINDKFEDDITNLIDTGKEKGYLTYGDVNDMLPEDISTSADDIDDLMTTIGSQGIDLLDAVLHAVFGAAHVAAHTITSAMTIGGMWSIVISGLAPWWLCAISSASGIERAVW